jgi:colicin import membrane protein
MVAHALQPPSADGLGTGALLALAVHGGLIAALTLGVSWRQQTAVEFSAEIWSSLPQVAAPPAPSPPGPSAADIALEKEKLRAAAAEAEREARDKLAKAAKDKADRRAAETRAEDQRIESQRQQNLDRLLAQAGGSGRADSSGTAARDAAPSSAYAGVLTEHIRSRIETDTSRLPKTLVTVVEIRSTPSGTVLARRIVKPSGHAIWDDAVVRAIDKAGTLPRDSNGLVPTSIEVTFRPPQ